MTLALSFLFVLVMIVSAFLQASDNPAKNVISPALTALCGLLIIYGYAAGNVPPPQGIALGAALLLLAASDFTFERATRNEKLFPLAILFGMVSGFIIGFSFILNAYAEDVPMAIFLTCFIVGAIAAILVYRYLEVEPGLRLAIYIYLPQAVILLAGGLLSWYSGNYHFAIWGVFIFFSDSLVGIRAFPSAKRPITWLTPYRILLLIIVLYYSAQYALVTWAV